MTSDVSSKIKFFLKLAVAVALIYFLLHSGYLKIDSLKALLTAPTVILGLALVGVNIWLLNWRWYWLLRSRNFNVAIGSTYALYLIGIFFNNALPSSVGGDVVKAFYLAREQKARQVDAVLSVLIDRVLGLYSLLLLSLVSVVWDFSFVKSQADVRWMAIMCAVLSLAMTVGLMIGFSTRIDRALRITSTLRKFPALKKIRELFEAMQLYGRQKSAILISIGASVIAQSFSVAFFVMVGEALGVSIPLTAYLFCIPLGFVATALPIAPAGVGVGQIAFLFLFHAYAPESRDMGAAAITAFQMAMLAWGAVGAVFYVKYKSPVVSEEWPHA